MTERDYISESQREFDKAAEKYDKKGPFYYRMTRWCDDAVIGAVEKIGGHCRRILDVGCGTGVLLEKLSLIHRDASFDGLDISEKMLDIARSRKTERVSWVKGNAETLPYEDNTMDIILCCSSFHHYPNPSMVLSEFKRVLKAGGTAVICEMSLPWIARQAANHVIFKIQRKGDVHVYSQTELMHLMHEAGFAGVKYDKISPVECMILGTKENS